MKLPGQIHPGVDETSPVAGGWGVATDGSSRDIRGLEEGSFQGKRKFLSLEAGEGKEPWADHHHKMSKRVRGASLGCLRQYFSLQMSKTSAS